MADRLDTVRRIAHEENTKLCLAYPEQEAAGGTLLLGKHYAHEQRGILMLGLNPGVNKYDSSFSVVTCTANHLLPGSPNKGFSYWRNAQTLFGTTTPLVTAMETATFSFCCQFRTPKWNGPDKRKHEALIERSRPILTQVLQDCNPRIVIVAGVAGLDALRAIAAPRLRMGALLSDGGDPAGTYQWRAYSASFDGVDLSIAQIPHPSRANSHVKLESCGKWLTELVTGADQLGPSASAASNLNSTARSAR